MPMPEVVTRFAPSPTGFLHIGGARIALYNWLFARGRGGKFLLRIEDTDKARSTPEATDAILEGLRWLGLDWDGEPISQASRSARHSEVAYEMLAAGRAYKCFATPEEIDAHREAARAEGRSTLYRSPWRDVEAATHPDAPFVIRLKAPQDGRTVIADAVQGDVRTDNSELDDMVLLRSDGSPTYMLAVVVDDHDMGVTHVIRGDDHLTNAARQAQIYAAMGWNEPVWAHVPLTHGPDGKKLSKRHGAVGLHEYATSGYPPEAMRNYLTRLGWSHGDDELFNDAQALAWFNLEGLGKAPARLDFKKLEHVSGHHISTMPAGTLMSHLDDFLKLTHAPALTEPARGRIETILPVLAQKARTLPALLEQAHFARIARPIEVDDKARTALQGDGRAMLADLTRSLDRDSWLRDRIEQDALRIAESYGVGLGKIAAPLRAALAGRTSTPSVFDMMVALGPEETLARISDQIA